MKIEQLIVQYLYLNKKVTLENIGTFFLADDIVIPKETDNVVPLPQNSIRFEFDIKALPDEGLTKYIIDQTRKIRPLATSDLESFSILGKQFLNLGKPLVIKDLGVLLKTQSEIYEFTQSQSMLSHIEIKGADSIDVETSEDDIDFSTPAKYVSKKKWIIPVALIVVVIITLLVFFLKNSSQKNIEVVQKNEVEVPIVINTDTIAKPKDTIVTTIPVAKDSPVATAVVVNNIQTDYKVVVRVYNDKESALKGFKTLSGFNFGKKIIMYTKDSINFKIAVPVKAAYKDSTRVRDSIKILFGKNPFIELN